MYLIIDEGNTRVKTAIYSDRRKLWYLEKPQFRLNDIEKVLNKYKPEGAIYSTVRKNEQNEEYANLKEQLNLFIDFDYKTPVPIKNLYQSKATLGLDRLAAAVAAKALFPGKNILVIDAGTAITYEFISSGGEYQGGNISPGINIRFSALNNGTGRLPLVSGSEIDFLVGKNTEEAIIAGVLNGVLFEVSKYIEQFKQQNKNACVIVTGGDCKFFDNKLKNDIFAVADLVLMGLYEILRFNDK
ncbi:MAG: pantothenate kinase [Marinilabiliales bacterium]|nr:MAG: pantothenate kinase [Marinilabiliales bacterium]